MKKIIFDIGHPAQVHNFKHIAYTLQRNDWSILFVAKDKEITKQLLEFYQFPFLILSKTKKGIFNKILGLLRDIFKFINILYSFKPNIVISRTSLHSGIGSKLFGIPNIAMADTENSLNITILFNYVLTPDIFYKNLGFKQIRFCGNIELCYLHKNHFIPDESSLNEYNLPKFNYAIIRFVSWNAHHDIGEGGIASEDKIELIKWLSQKMKIVLTSENAIPEEFKQYVIKIAPEKMHDVMAYASLYIGEGGTMASEASMLGVKTIYINSLEPGYLKDENQKGLLKSFRKIDFS